MYTDGRVCGRVVGVAAPLLCECKALKYRIKRTRQSLPPLYERESSSRLHIFAVSVVLRWERHIGVVNAIGQDMAYLYRCNASSMTLKLNRVCACTRFSLSVDASAARKAATRACTLAHSSGNAVPSWGFIVSVRPCSSLRTPRRGSGIT